MNFSHTAHKFPNILCVYFYAGSLKMPYLFDIFSILFLVGGGVTSATLWQFMPEPFPT